MCYMYVASRRERTPGTQSEAVGDSNTLPSNLESELKQTKLQWAQGASEAPSTIRHYRVTTQGRTEERSRNVRGKCAESARKNLQQYLLSQIMSEHDFEHSFIDSYPIGFF